MPTYEYRCPNGHHFERIAKMSESAGELPCPECGAMAARQISGGAGLVFKGTGFYLTDYGRNAHRGNGGEVAAKGGESKGGESKSGESKGGESKGAESKGGESKSTESKPSDSKSSSSSTESKKASAAAPSSSSSASKTDQ